MRVKIGQGEGFSEAHRDVRLAQALELIKGVFRTGYAHWHNGHAALERQHDRAGFAFLQFRILAARAFGRDAQRHTPRQHLGCFADGGKISNVAVDPDALGGFGEPLDEGLVLVLGGDQRGDVRPLRIDKYHRRIQVAVMVDGEDHAASRRYIFVIDEFDPGQVPDQETDDTL